eukprot:100937-Pelagomonas_calceolata.AAC.12
MQAHLAGSDSRTPGTRMSCWRCPHPLVLAAGPNAQPEGGKKKRDYGTRCLDCYEGASHVLAAGPSARPVGGNGVC